MAKDSTYDQERQSPVDLIDFRCSDSYLDFYHAQRLTPRCSGQIRQMPTAKELRRMLLAEADGRPINVARGMDQLREDLHCVRAENTRLRAELQTLRHKGANENNHEPSFKGIPNLDVCTER